MLAALTAFGFFAGGRNSGLYAEICRSASPCPACSPCSATAAASAVSSPARAALIRATAAAAWSSPWSMVLTVTLRFSVASFLEILK